CLAPEDLGDPRYAARVSRQVELDGTSGRTKGEAESWNWPDVRPGIRRTRPISRRHPVVSDPSRRDRLLHVPQREDKRTLPPALAARQVASIAKCRGATSSSVKMSARRPRRGAY